MLMLKLIISLYIHTLIVLTSCKLHSYSWNPLANTLYCITASWLFINPPSHCKGVPATSCPRNQQIYGIIINTYPTRASHKYCVLLLTLADRHMALKFLVHNWGQLVQTKPSPLHYRCSARLLHMYRTSGKVITVQVNIKAILQTWHLTHLKWQKPLHIIFEDLCVKEH